MRVYDPKNISCTLLSQGGGMGAKTGLYKIVNSENQKIRIRKLTPKECWRLMGYTDADFDKAAKVNSNTQLYRQAGNAIVKQVLMAIFSQLSIQSITPWNEREETIFEGVRNDR